MKQSGLYAALNFAGCKILSFEDFPSNGGSWRVCFSIDKTVCQVTCNRADNLLLLSSKSTVYGNSSSSIDSKHLVTDLMELAKLREWLYTVQGTKKDTLKLPERNDVLYH